MACHSPRRRRQSSSTSQLSCQRADTSQLVHEEWGHVSNARNGEQRPSASAPDTKMPSSSQPRHNRCLECRSQRQGKCMSTIPGFVLSTTNFYRTRSRVRSKESIPIPWKTNGKEDREYLLCRWEVGSMRLVARAAKDAFRIQGASDIACDERVPSFPPGSSPSCAIRWRRRVHEPTDAVRASLRSTTREETPRSFIGRSWSNVAKKRIGTWEGSRPWPSCDGGVCRLWKGSAWKKGSKIRQDGTDPKTWVETTRWRRGEDVCRTTRLLTRRWTCERREETEKRRRNERKRAGSDNRDARCESQAAGGCKDVDSLSRVHARVVFRSKERRPQDESCGRIRCIERIATYPC